MTGTASQIEWSDLIKVRVNAEFDRVATAFRTVAEKQAEVDRLETLAILGLVEEKRSEVLANPSAGYFIKHWMEMGDQVRKMLGDDPRYKAIQESRASRRAQH